MEKLCLLFLFVTTVFLHLTEKGMCVKQNKLRKEFKALEKMLVAQSEWLTLKMETGDENLLRNFNETLEYYIDKHQNQFDWLHLTMQEERKDLWKVLNDTIDSIKAEYQNHLNSMSTKIDKNSMIIEGISEKMNLIMTDQYTKGTEDSSQTSEHTIKSDWPNAMKTLSEKSDKNSKSIKHLSDSLIQIKRGVADEKRARKTYAEEVKEKVLRIKRDFSDEKQARENYTHVVTDKLTRIETGSENLEQKITNQTGSLRSEITDLKENLKEFINATQDRVVASVVKSLSNGPNNLHKPASENEQKLFITESMKKHMHPPVCGNKLQNISNITVYFADQLEHVSKNISKINIYLADHFESLVREVHHIIHLIGSVRLAGGKGPHEGQVEGWYKGTYGAVCNDLWDDLDARVVCRMVGFTDGTALQETDKTFLSNNDEMLMNNVDCTGRESSLFYCVHTGPKARSCGPGKVAQVRCV